MYKATNVWRHYTRWAELNGANFLPSTETFKCMYNKKASYRKRIARLPMQSIWVNNSWKNFITLWGCIDVI